MGVLDIPILILGDVGTFADPAVSGPSLLAPFILDPEAVLAGFEATRQGGLAVFALMAHWLQLLSGLAAGCYRKYYYSSLPLTFTTTPILELLHQPTLDFLSLWAWPLLAATCLIVAISLACALLRYARAGSGDRVRVRVQVVKGTGRDGAQRSWQAICGLGTTTMRAGAPPSRAFGCAVSAPEKLRVKFVGGEDDDKKKTEAPPQKQKERKNRVFSIPIPVEQLRGGAARTALALWETFRRPGWLALRVAFALAVAGRGLLLLRPYLSSFLDAGGSSTLARYESAAARVLWEAVAVSDVIVALFAFCLCLVAAWASCLALRLLASAVRAGRRGRDWYRSFYVGNGRVFTVFYFVNCAAAAAEK